MALLEWAPDGIVCAEANPLWDGPVLLGLLGQLLLDAEGLLGRLHAQRTNHYQATEEKAHGY